MSPSSSGLHPHCLLHNKVGHLVVACCHKIDQAFQATLSSQTYVATSHLAVNSSWYPNNGATSHITYELQNLNLHESTLDRIKGELAMVKVWIFITQVLLYYPLLAPCPRMGRRYFFPYKISHLIFGASPPICVLGCGSGFLVHPPWSNVHLRLS